MQHAKKHVLILTALVLLVALTLVFVACNGDDNQSVSDGVNVIYHFNDGTDGTHEVQGAKLQDIAAYAPPSREGYEFKGWALDANGTQSFRPNTFKGTSVELYAIWDMLKFTVTFRIDASKEEIERTDVPYGGAVELPTAAELDGRVPSGYTLEGWLDGADGEIMDEDDPDAAYKHITQNVTFYAKLKQDKATIKFYVGETLYELTGNIGESIVLSGELTQATVPQTGFRFQGWFTEGGDMLDLSASPKFASDETYYAKFALRRPEQPILDGDYDISDIEIVYGDDLTLSIIEEYAPTDITYGYEWYLGDQKVADGASYALPIQQLGVGERNYTVRLVASAEGYDSVISDDLAIKVVVTPATLSYTLQQLSIEYGASLPAADSLSITFEGFKYGETADVLAKTLSINSDDYTPGAPVGEYTYRLNGVSADNYVVASDSNEATLKVEPKQVSVALKANEDISCKYGAIPETFEPAGSKYDVQGLLANHTLALSLKLAADSIPGDYTVANGVVPTVKISDGSGEDVTQNYAATVAATIKVGLGTLSRTLPANTKFTYNGEEQTVAITDVTAGCEPLYRLDEESEYSNEVPAFLNAGKYTVYYKLALRYYETEEGSFEVTIGKAVVNVTVKEQRTTYGAPFTLVSKGDAAYQITSDVPGGEVFELEAICDYVPGDPEKGNVGEYDITIKHVDDDNIEFNIINNKLIVSAASITIEPKQIDVTYGDDLDASKLFTVQDKPALGAEPKVTATTEYVAGKPAGTSYAVTLTFENDTNYNVTVGGDGQVTVVQREVGIKIDDATVVYGEDVQQDAYKFALQDGEMYNGEQLELSFSTNYRKGDAAEGTHEISATPTEAEVNKNYKVTIAKGTLTVSKRPVSLKVKDMSVRYGDALDGGFSYDLLDGTTFYGSAPAPRYSTQYVAGATSGTVEAAFDDANHRINVQNGTINVQKRDIVITLNSVHAYDGHPYSHTFSAKDSAVGNLFEKDSISGTLATNSGENATYNDFDSMFTWTDPLKITNESEQDVTEFYNATYILNIQISDVLIELSVAGWEGEYDGQLHTGSASIKGVENLSNAKITYSATGDEYSDELPKFKNFGTYTVHVKATADDRTDTFAEFTVTITKRNATLAANGASVTFGDDSPAYGYTQTKILAEDVEALEITLECDYQKGDDVRQDGYEIRVRYTSNDNYDIKVTNGKLTVSPKPVNVTLSSPAKIAYGEAFAYDGEYTFDDESVTDTLAFTTAYRQGNGVNDYAIYATGSANYAYTVLTKLTVEPRKATITLAQTTATYGEDLLEKLKRNTSFANMYGSDSVEVQYGGYEKNANPSGYDVTMSATDPNYTFEYVQNKLIVNKARLTLTLDGATNVTYGDALPAYTVSKAEGLVGGDADWNAVVTGELAVTCEYPANRNVGTYAVNGGGYTSANYDITYTALSLNVGKATLTARAKALDHTLKYNEELPAQIGYTVEGLKYEDNAESLGLPATLPLSSAYKKGNNVGAYTYNVDIQSIEDLPALSNYSLTLASAISFNLAKADYTGITHSAITTMTYSSDLKLSGISLNTGSYKNFYWKDASEHPTCDKTSYEAYYNADATNYNNFDLTITVTLKKATPTITAETPSPERDWTGSVFTFKSLFGNVTSDNPETSVKYSADIQSGSDGGKYTVYFSTDETTNYNAVKQAFYVKIKAADLGGTLYTIEDALNKATSGQTVKVLHNSFISENVTIKAGVTLLLPYDGNDGLHSTNSAEAVNRFASQNEGAYLKLTVTILKNVTLTNNGALSIGGITTGGNGGAAGAGQTSGDFAKLALDAGAKIDSTGDITAYGFISETTKNNGSSVIVRNGQVLAPFIVVEHRGGSTFSEMSGDMKGAPFNRFYVENIAPLLQIYSSATMLGHANLYTSSIIKQDNETNINLIGNSSGHLIQLGENSYLTAKYDVNSKITQLNIYGDMTLNSMSLTLKVMGITKTLSTKDIFFPLSWYYNVTLNTLPNSSTTEAATATVKFNQNLKILPGGVLKINEGVTVNANQILVADKDYSIPTVNSFKYDGSGDGMLIVNGTLNVQNIGGKVRSEKANAVLQVTGAASATTSELASSEGSFPLTTITWQEKSLKLQDESGTELSTGTYTYDGKTWTKV